MFSKWPTGKLDLFLHANNADLELSCYQKLRHHHWHFRQDSKDPSFTDAQNLMIVHMAKVLVCNFKHCVQKTTSIPVVFWFGIGTMCNSIISVLTHLFVYIARRLVSIMLYCHQSNDMNTTRQISWFWIRI